MRSLPRRIIGVFLILACAGAAFGQMARWQIANPSLIINLPAQGGAGAVKWHEPPLMSFLPTSWVFENDELRAEVAYTFSSESPQELAQKLGGKLGLLVESLRQTEISSYPAAYFGLKGRQGITVSADGRAWTILLIPKTSGGSTAVQKLMSGIVLERAGAPRWVRRSLGGTNLLAELPYDPAIFHGKSGGSDQVFEVYFEDYAVEASVSKAGEDKRVDYEGTIKGYIESERGMPGTKNFTVKRERLARERLKGDLITLEMERDNKKGRFITAFMMDDEKLVRLDLREDLTKPAHDVFSRRIIQSLQASNVNLSGFKPHQVGNEGVWLDSSKPFESSGSSGEIRRYGVFAGAFAVDIRVQPLLPGVRQNIDQFMSIQQAALTPREKVRDLTSDTAKRFVDGMDARVLTLKYKLPGRADFTQRTSFVIFMPDRTFVADMITSQEQVPYLERIIETARVELQAPPGWARHPVGEGGLTLLSPQAPKNEKFTNAVPGTEYVILSEFDAPGVIGEVQDMKYKSAPPMPALVLRDQVQRLKDALGKEVRIVEQRMYETAGKSGVLADIEIDTPAGGAPGNLVVLRSGDRVFVLTLLTEASRPNHTARLTVLNSLR